jgi:glycosyltransferase involved in cell wall biosynthesis
MKKVVIISPYTRSLLDFRGDLIKDLVKLNHKVIALGPDDGFEKNINEVGAEYCKYYLQRTGLNPLSELKSIVSLSKILKKIKPDIVFSYAIKPSIYGSLAATKNGIMKKYSMITGLGYTFTGKSIRHKSLQWLLKKLFKISFRFNNAVFFQNPDDLIDFVNMSIINSNIKTKVVDGSGVNIDCYYSTKPVIKPISFLLIARLIWDKGIKEYVEAAKILKKKYSEVEFSILGPIDSNPAAIKMNEINDWVKNGWITYLGGKEDVRPYLSKCSVYVLPSFYREGTPRSILEAMSMGKPIITTDSPGCRETVKEGENGFLVPIKNPIELANAMKRFILEPDIINEMGKKSREEVEKRYDVRKVNKAILETMELI